MPADMADDSADLLKTMEENRKALQKQIGCLAGILQIFDRQRCFTGRRYGSNRTSATNEDGASTACGTDVFHEPCSPSSFHKFEEQPPGAKVPFYEENRGSAAFEQGMFTNTEEASPCPFSSHFVNQPPRISENESPRRETPENPTLQHRSPGTPVTPAAQRRMSMDGRLSFENFSRSPDSSHIRNIVVNSLHKENPRASVDNSNREVMAGLIRLKNLARSRSVGGRNGYSRTNAEFPRSSSLSAQRSSGVFKDGDELAIRAEDAPELLARERIASNLTHPRRSVNGSETPRLTVELEDGPGVGTKKLQGMNSHNYHERDPARQAVMNLDKALAALDLKESYGALHREKSIRRSPVDEEQTEASVAPRPCGNATRSPPRELPSTRDEHEGRRGGANVVARLMGLEEFSSSSPLRKDAGSKDGIGDGQERRGRSPSPKHRLMDGMPSPLRQKEAREALKGRFTKSTKHLYEEGPLLTLQGGKPPSPTLEPLHGDIIQRLQQLRSRNSVEDRETLNQILETLHLKGLLHSPQRKSSATPEYVRQRCATTKDGSDQAFYEPMTDNKTKPNLGMKPVLVMKPIQKDADCKSGRSECSERSDATTGSRFSSEDGGSTKPGRGKSKSPVRSSRGSLRVNSDARSTAQVSAHPVAVASTNLRSNSPTSSCSNARMPHVKQLLQGPANSHQRDNKESKAAQVTVRGTQLHGVFLKNNPVYDAKLDGTTKNCEAQTVTSLGKGARQKLACRNTSRDSPSLVPSPSPGRDFESSNSSTSETVVDKKEASSEADSLAPAVISTGHDPSMVCETLNNTPARIREILQTLKTQHIPLQNSSEVKVSHEVITPRAGFQVDKICQALQKSRHGSEGCEQRSPVSVLDNNVFEDDGSPSPMVADHLQDSYESNEHAVRLENAMELATTSSTFVGTKPDHNATMSKERDFVDEPLMLSGITKHANWESGTFSSRIKQSDMDPRFSVDLKDLQRASDVFFLKCHKQEQGNQVNMLDRHPLIDLVNELLAIKVAEIENGQPWPESTWIGDGQDFKRQNLVNSVWKELQEFPCAESGDVCDTVQGILQEDLGSRGPKWTDFRAEIGEVGVEVEKLIYRDLVEEVAKDLKCSGSSRYVEKLLEGSSGPRRQLFAL